MSEQVGKRTWVFPDGEMPQPGEFPVKAHESIIILNSSDEPAICRLSVYYTDREPYSDIVVRVDVGANDAQWTENHRDTR